jgi:hypothetical protein
MGWGKELDRVSAQVLAWKLGKRSGVEKEAAWALLLAHWTVLSSWALPL